MNIQLDADEIRILGCLMEKAITTPDQYPLTLNALTNACNQKSSRDPVMALEPGRVGHIARKLEERHLLNQSEGKNGVLKYTQRLCNTLLGELKFDSGEYAIITLLLLRGPQTPGELRSRSGRLHNFADNQQVKETLGRLIDRAEGPVVARLAKKTGRQDHEYTHLFSGQVETVEEEPEVILRDETTNQRSDRITELEDRVHRLETALSALAEQLGEELDLNLDSQAGCSD